MVRRFAVWLLPAFSLLTAALLGGPALGQTGYILNGQGPVNRSIGGASTAAPLDASGALYWNPASISGLPSSELEAGAELLWIRTKLSSSIPVGSLGFGFPPVGLSGSTNGDDGVFPLPDIGLVYKPEASDITYGFGTFLLGGFGTNYPGSTTNPILTPSPPGGLGVGPIFVQLQMLQMAPTVAVQLTEHLSIGVAPTLDMAQLQADPGLFLPPDTTGAFPAYEPMTHTRYSWGAGFQAGLYYTTEAGWNFGTSVKSPQWFEPFRYFTMDAAGVPHTGKVHLDTPLIASTGVAYTGIEGWVLAADFRYTDFSNTEGFEGIQFDSNGALTDLGWRSVFGLALGAQYQVTPCLAVRAGYDYNMNPVRSQNAAYNVGTPTIVEHTLSVGASYSLTKCFILSASYQHFFTHSITGPYQTPAGPIPGASITDQAGADSIALGFQVRF